MQMKNRHIYISISIFLINMHTYIEFVINGNEKFS